jgi:hypothetical protein
MLKITVGIDAGEILASMEVKEPRWKRREQLACFGSVGCGDTLDDMDVRDDRGLLGIRLRIGPLPDRPVRTYRKRRDANLISAFVALKLSEYVRLHLSRYPLTNTSLSVQLLG